MQPTVNLVGAGTQFLDANLHAVRSGRQLTREDCLRLAGEANIAQWFARRGIPFTVCRYGRFAHANIPSLEFSGSLWRRMDNGYGVLGQYASGDLVTYLIEYEGLGYEEAVQLILDDLCPGTILPSVSESPLSAVQDRRRTLTERLGTAQGK